MTHSWCRDIPRDEAVRAAEDGREGPLPTLEEAIAAFSPSEEGLRTERVTLEIVRGDGLHVRQWPWHDILQAWGLGEEDEAESVRVVEEPLSDAWAQMLNRLANERDAAIRERDKLRAERITQALTADRFAAAVAEADRLRARVAELEAAAKLAPAANADGISSSQPISGAGKSAVEEMSRSGQFASSEAATEQKCPERESVTNRRLPEPGGSGNVTPFAEQAKRSAAVSPTGDGQSGLRTERVVLEVTHDLDAPLGEWIVQVLDESLGYDEYVRVVEETHFDDLANMALERDAAIRERDELRGERIGGGWWFPKYDLPSLPPSPPPAPPRVHRGSGVFDANGDEVPWEGVVAAMEAEFAAAVADNDGLRARVAELEQARERFDTALEEARTRSGINDLILQRDEALEEWDAAIRERDTARAECKRLLEAQVKASQERDRADEARGRIRSEWERRGKSLHVAYGTIGTLKARVVGLESQLESVACRAATAENRVAELEQQAMSLKKSLKETRVVMGAAMAERDAAIKAAELLPENPLPATPDASGNSQAILDGSSAASGWLTDIDVLRALLARSSPPEVVRPAMWVRFSVYDYDMGQEEQQIRDAEWIAALAAAGVTVKEVGK